MTRPSPHRIRWGLIFAVWTGYGLLVYIMVDSVAATIDTVTAQGGTLVSRSARTHPR